MHPNAERPDDIARLAYRLVATVLKTPLRFVPTVPMTVTAATAINAAIRPYSMAVAPHSSLKIFAKILKTFILMHQVVKHD